MSTANTIANALRKRGFKITPQRRAVLDVIAVSQGHLTPAEIHARVCKKHAGVGLVTVYRTLEMLAQMDLLCEVHTGGRQRSFLLRRPMEHHHHLICSDCGRVFDFTNCGLHELEARIAEETGFRTEGHVLEFFGSCPACQAPEKKT